MKKLPKVLLFSSLSLLAVSGIALGVISCVPEIIPANNVKALAESTGYFMNFDSSDKGNVSYHYANQKLIKKNYNNEDITFNYKRCRQGSNSMFMIMSGGGSIYNPYINSHTNKNSLNGISSLTVNFSSKSGKLFISYGLDENYLDEGIELQSGVPYTFTTFKPSHFKIYSLDDANSDADIYITDIEIAYHSNSYYDANGYSFTNVYENKIANSLSANESKTISFNNMDIGSNNYINIKYRSSENLYCVLTIYNVSQSKNTEEVIFLEKSDTLTEFRMFLDAFRKGASGVGNKKLVSLSIKNVGSNSANYLINSVGHTNRTYSRSDVVYISDNTIEVGVSLQFAGSISSVKNLDQNIQEYVTNDEEIKIRGSDKHSGDVMNVITNNPNLVNTYDVGREIQQSWYINVDADQGYSRGEFNGANVSYNPVQAGDKNNNESQIVDYKITYDEVNSAKATSLWIKTKALDWAKTNTISTSYMENTYKVENGLIKVDNRFIDFSGWQNYMDNANYPEGNANTNGNDFYSVSQKNLYSLEELPAIYVSHPLNYYSSYFSDTSTSNTGKLIFDNGQGWNTGTGTTAIEYSDALVSNGSYNSETTYQLDFDAYKANHTNASSGTSYHYAFRKHSENWLGYFNEDKFGLAVYMPANDYNHDTIDRHVYTSGSLYSDHLASNSVNRTYLDSDYAKQTAEYKKGYTIGSKVYGRTPLTKESCYMNNTGYLASYMGFYVPNYIPMEYSYFIGADYLNTLRNKFATYGEEINNDFTSWKGALI